MKTKRIVLSTFFSVLALIFLGVCITTAKKQLNPSDFTPLFRWWLTLVMLSLAFFPLAACLFKNFSDRGVIFAKVLGIVGGGWVIYVLSSLHIVKFTATGCIVTAILCATVNYGCLIYSFRKKRKELPDFLGVTNECFVIPKALWFEVFFFAVFAVLTYIKCFKPEANGTEKFMDYGFMTSMMKSEFMPPEDFWFSGTDLNYYYLGQFFATYLCKLSGVTVNYGYNLALMMTGALCMVLTYSLTSQIFGTFLKEYFEDKKKKWNGWYLVFTAVVMRVAGFVSGIAVTFASNCHYYVYARLVPIFREILHIEGNVDYWFPDATRYIGYQREGTGDKTIHEFPSYSFVLGDLHAHVANIIFVLTLLAILFAFLLNRRKAMKEAVEGKLCEINYKKELLNPLIIALSFFIGIFKMTNFWDFPIYFVVCGAVILTSNAVICGFSKKTFILTALHALEFIVISFLTAFMFSIRFDSMTGGIAFCKKHTELYQMIVVWAFPLVSTFLYLCTLVKEEIERKKESKPDVIKRNAFFTWISHLKVSELFLVILSLCAAGLVLIPEVIYVVDIYSGEYARANTMFKLTYQAFILFGICLGAFITRYLFMANGVKQFLGGVLMLFLLYENTLYFNKACKSWFGDIKNKELYQTLDAGAFIEKILPEDAKAIAWIEENIKGRPVILEMNGDSYTEYNRVSVLTGCPTILGWYTHEWLWKNNPDLVGKRSNDVMTIYGGFEEIREEVVSLLKKYNVSYLYVGKMERSKYAPTGAGEDQTGFLLDYDFLRSLGEVVYEGSEKLYYDTFIVKIQY